MKMYCLHRVQEKLTHTYTYIYIYIYIHIYICIYAPTRLLLSKRTAVTTVLDVAVTPNQPFRSLPDFHPVLLLHASPLVES
jgi:hypothetical protein